MVSTGLKKTVNTTYSLALYHCAEFLTRAQQRLFAVKNYEAGLASFFSHIPLHSVNHCHPCGRIERHSVYTLHHPGQCMKGSRRRLKWISVQRSGRMQTPGCHQFCNYVKQTKQKLIPLLMKKAYGRFLCDGQRGGKSGASDIISVVGQESQETGKETWEGRDRQQQSVTSFLFSLPTSFFRVVTPKPIWHLSDDDILLQLPVSFSLLLSSVK